MLLVTLAIPTMSSTISISTSQKNTTTSQPVSLDTKTSPLIEKWKSGLENKRPRKANIGVLRENWRTCQTYWKEKRTSTRERKYTTIIGAWWWISRKWWQYPCICHSRWEEGVLTKWCSRVANVAASASATEPVLVKLQSKGQQNIPIVLWLHQT